MHYNSAIYWVYFLIKTVIDELSRLKLSEEQIALRRISGKTFDKREAAQLWRKIGEHKWLLSEQLGRDVGTKVATFDYLENFAGREDSLDYSDPSPDAYASLNNSFA